MFFTIKELHEQYHEKKTTVKEVVLSCLTRIAAVDATPEGFNAVAEVNPDVLPIAEACDRQLTAGGGLPTLFGVPVLLKDNINTGDKLHTTVGSLALADNYAPCDAPLVGLLRQAGAVIIGKTNLTEFANYMTREKMPNGYSSRGGQVFNPFNRAEDPSGSSTGSAVAVAAGLCCVAVGTETSGSIISPAGENGVIGIKPTAGLIDGVGIAPISGTFDTAGPMARTVRDAAVLLGVLADKDFTQYATDLKGLRIGYNGEKTREALKDKPAEAAVFERLCDLLTDAGAVLVDDIDFTPDYETRMTIMQYEFKAAFNHYLSTLKNAPKTLLEIIQFNQAHASAALKYGQSLLLDAQNKASGKLTDPAYLHALVKREEAIKQFDGLFESYNVDVLMGNAFAYTAPYTGHPGITVPTGQNPENKLPHKAVFAARRGREVNLLTVGHVIESALGTVPHP